MQKKTRMQKISLFFSIICFIGTLGCVAAVLFAGSDATDIYKASFAASSFFLFTCGIVLFTMARANLPNFKFDDKDED
jgi:hypothetical protein